MNNDTELLKKRFAELARRADGRGCLLYSGFLSLNEQSALASVARTLPAPYSLYGGADGCERRMARFGYAEGDDTEGYPIDIIEIAPKSEKFASDLTHRDFLGALMHTGVEREKIGDIIVRGKHAYAFVEARLRRTLRIRLKPWGGRALSAAWARLCRKASFSVRRRALCAYQAFALMH